MTLEQILEIFSEDELLKADGFDDAVIGIDAVKLRLVYDVDKMRSILVDQEGMSFDEAMEYLDYNVLGAYVGEQTPLYIQI
jgi:hypothetical protein